jgi:trehalose 6-phosphate synthase
LTRLVIASNRVAIPHRRGAAQGGLATGLLEALDRRGGLWFGWNGRISENPDSAPILQTEGSLTFALTTLTHLEFEGYYVGFANRCLWPVFHAQLHLLHYDRASFETYLAVNERWARILSTQIGSGDLVWIHDYHLIPLAFALRNRGIQAPLGFFLHTPFPGVDLLRALPDQTEILERLLAYDLVGFQTSLDCQSFFRAVSFFLPEARRSADGIRFRGREIRVASFPIGIDVDEVARLARAGQQNRHGRRLATSLSGRRLILGIDRLDYSKGLALRFRAYARLLEHWAEFRRQIVLLQIAPLSRTEVPEYGEIRRELNEIVGDIHARYAEYDWMPLRYLTRGFPRSTILGFLRQAGIGLITPLRDGMNLVAKEFVASQPEESPGVLILSSLAGAAQELEEALIVNPYDMGAVARALAQALAMGLEERRQRWSALMDRLRKYDLHHWTDSFLEALAGTRPRSSP